MQILELGCGRAEKTRAIATTGTNRCIVALEVDETQHARNLQIDDLPNVRFGFGGAEAIPAADASFDVVFLFKSLHHVPVESMDEALREIARVLRPGGHAYVAEPLFRGAFNDVLRLFHDESRVRRAAFAAIVGAVKSGLLESVAQTFFRAPLRFADFAEFEQLVIGTTHTRHRLSDETHERVRAAFAGHMGAGGVRFEQPIRVDLLRRPA
jgi:ubiquinone/menaquinone biosynthesis C-methylase UbiE